MALGRLAFVIMLRLSLESESDCGEKNCDNQDPFKHIWNSPLLTVCGVQGKSMLSTSQWGYPNLPIPTSGIKARHFYFDILFSNSNVFGALFKKEFVALSINPLPNITFFSLLRWYGCAAEQEQGKKQRMRGQYTLTCPI